jgi:hypothetical protein
MAGRDLSAEGFEERLRQLATLEGIEGRRRCISWAARGDGATERGGPRHYATGAHPFHRGNVGVGAVGAGAGHGLIAVYAAARGRVRGISQFLRGGRPLVLT